MNLKSRWSWLWGVGLGVLSIILHIFTPVGLVERWYGHGIYPGVRFLIDHTVSLTILPFFYVVWVLGLLWVYRMIKQLTQNDGRNKWILFSRRFVSLLGWVVFLFYFLWGFNYDRVLLADRLSWQSESFEENEFLLEAREQVQMLSSLRGEVEKDLEKSLLKDNYQLLEITIRKEASAIASALGYLEKTGVRCRQLFPKGILLRFSTAGFYNPLTGECNIDRGLHHLQKPFIMAHEFFHALGVTGEGDCNFLAYVLCHKSPHAYIRYSGELVYWRYLRGGVYRHNKELYSRIVADLDERVKMDLREIEENLEHYPDIAPRMRDRIYNAYLHSNKIPDGMANYNNIVSLVMQWRKEGYEL